VSQVITFEDYTPSPRYDELPWTEARIEEGATATGPWTQIDVITLDPVDPDPAHPLSRDFTTENADDAFGLWYRIVFADETGDLLQPTLPVQNAPLADHNYVTREQLKRSLELSGLSYADSDIDVAIAAASRGVDEITQRRFWLDTVADDRFYTPRWSKLDIDDLAELTAVEAIDSAGTASAVLTEGTDFSLYPINAQLDNRPFEALWLLSTSSYPTYTWSPPFPDLVKVTGRFGWPTLPSEVVAATTILATRYLRRQREAPFGIITVGIEQGAAMRIGRYDPDVENLLCNFKKPRVMIS